MTFNKIVSGFAGVALALSVSVTSAFAASYPINHPRHADWSFAGVFGHWDLGQLQRGFKVYRENCASCHSLDLVAFRNLEDLGFSEDEVKAIAAEYEITDGPNNDGEMFQRPGVPADRFPGPYANPQEAASVNNGAVPPDFSLLAKARAPERGFPTFVFDIFTAYAENGPDYIYSLLTGYTDPPAGVEVPEGVYYNPYFAGGSALAMASPLFADAVEYTDGTPMTVDQYAKDVSAFMMWAAEPSLVERKSLGFKVMIFLLLFAALLYLTKKKIWSALSNEGFGGSSGGVSPMALAGAAPGGSTLVTPTASARRAGVDYVDDIELIDGIGATIAKRLKANGVNSLVKIATMTSAELDKLGEKINAANRPVREEWQAQARELIDGKPPRAAIDRAKVEKTLGKKF